MRWTKGNLLNLRKVILHILIEAKLPNLAKRELSLRPAVRKIKDIDLLRLPQLLSLLRGHGLHAQVPLGELAALDGLVEVLLVGVRRAPRRLLLGQEAGALLRADVDLAVHPGPLLVDELEGVAAEAVHVAPAVGDTAVAKGVHDLVDGLGVLAEVFPEHGGVVAAAQVARGMPLLGMDQVGELGRIPDEEDGRVVLDEVPVALFGAELDGEPARVAGVVVGTAFAADGGEADGDGTFFAFRGEDVCEAEVVEGVGGSVVAVGAAAFGVDDSLGDSFAVKVGEEIDQVEVL